jgi:hypothetical protein
MSSTATRVLRAATIAIILVIALAACRAAAVDAPPTGTLPTDTPSAEAPSAEAPRPAAVKTTPGAPSPSAKSATRRPAAKPRTTGPDPCADLHRSISSGPVQMGPHTTDELYLVRVERHACADQVIFRVNGTAGFGAHAEYVPQARAARSGQPVDLRGGAALQIVVFAPDFAHPGSGHQPGRKPWRVGQEVARVPGGWPALHEVAYAGANDGSETVFVIGVRRTLPFTLTWRGGDGYSEVILEIAHRKPDRTSNCTC